jgi:hypothetical protein
MPELDHIGIAVRSIAQARKLYESSTSTSAPP